MIAEVFLLFSGFVLKWNVHAQFGSISIGVEMEDERNNDDGLDLLKLAQHDHCRQIGAAKTADAFSPAFIVYRVSPTARNLSVLCGLGTSLTCVQASSRCSPSPQSFMGPCPPNTTCMPISMCPMLGDLLDFSCFSSDKYFHRLNELTCGQVSGEDYVCCPSCECGKVYPDNTDRCGRSMVQGVDYKGLGAQPWVARIGFTQKESGIVRFACSGSIISKRVVLTAAHCALAKPEGYKLSTVVVGEYDTSRGPDCSELFCALPTQAIKVENVVVHVGYEQKIFRHDIALIALKDEMKYSVSVAPICLNDKPEIVINERALLVGWGKLSGQNNLVSRQQQLQVPLVPLATCERIFGDSVPVHEGQLCAGGEEGRDACSGFGGAPLLLSRDGQYVQVGIVSFGSENCGSEGVPSVYTNIAHYYKWIVDNSPS